MSCIITYKGSKYTQEQFKEYIYNNKNEFSHIIASNKNVIDSFKRKMEGIDFVFSQSPELASIGSKAQYLQYLSTIFKTSKVKDIVYHAGRQGIEKFDKRFIGSGSGVKKGSKGFYFADTLAAIWNYEEKLNAVEERSQKYSVLLNIVNPELAEYTYTIETNERDGKIFRRYGDPLKTIDENIKNKDSEHIRIVYPKYETYSYPVEANIIRQEPNPIKNEYVVFEPEQIHILGGKQDIE